MLSYEAARALMLITLIVSAAAMPLAYVAKHRWYNLRLTRTLSVVGVASMVTFMALAYLYLPD